MKIEELIRNLSTKLIASGKWAPHPFVKNGLIALSIIREWDFEQLAMMAENPDFLDWYLEKEKATGQSGFAEG